MFGPLGGVVSDLDGVVYRGEEPIPASVEAFLRWRRLGVPYAFVTNNSTLSPDSFARKLSRFGVEATPEQVFSSLAATVALMKQRWPRGARVFAIGEAPLLAAIEEAGFALTPTEPDIVTLGYDGALTYEKLRRAVRGALAGAAVIATNPDPLTPTHDGYDPCVGVLVAAICAAAPNARPIVVGKPEPLMIEQALAWLGTPRAQTIMIGDQIATDILAGQRAGLRSILLAGDSPLNAGAAARPDGIVASLLDLFAQPRGRT
jgi:4-nitrophenyl phosphatase